MFDVDNGKTDMIQSRRTTQKREDTSTRILKLEKRLKRVQNDLYSISGELKSIRKTV